MSVITAIVRNDMRRMMRDRFLLGMSVYILGIALALRWILPWVQAELLAANGFDLAPYYPLAVSYFVLVNTCLLTGMVSGFLLLETREERTVHALRVTPVPMATHLSTMGGWVVLAGFALILALSAAIGLGLPDAQAVVVAAALVAPTGFVMCLIMATAASNKVEAFAVMKIVSSLGMVPLLAYFVPEPFQYLLGVAPPYWACKLWWEAEAGNPGWGWFVAPGLVVSAIWIAVLLKRFEVAVSR